MIGFVKLFNCTVEKIQAGDKEIAVIKGSEFTRWGDDKVNATWYLMPKPHNQSYVVNQVEKRDIQTFRISAVTKVNLVADDRPSVYAIVEGIEYI